MDDLRSRMYDQPDQLFCLVYILNLYRIKIDDTMIFMTFYNRIGKKYLFNIITHICVLACLILSPAFVSYSQAEEIQDHWYDTANEYHADIDYADMDSSGVDRDRGYALIEDLESAAAAGNLDKMIEAYEGVGSFADHVSTQSTLNDIKYYTDVNNEEYRKKQLEITDFSMEYLDDFKLAVQKVLKGSRGDDFAEYLDDEELVDYFLEYEEMTEEDKALALEYDELVQEYNTQLLADLHVTVDGEDWNTEKLNDSTRLNYRQYLEVYTELARAKNKILCELYIKIVDNRNKTAAKYDYDNFADFAYEEEYNRDYTTEDIRSVYEGVKEYIVPLYSELESMQGYNYKLDHMNLTGEERLQRVAPIISRIDPELQTAWDYMIEHHLYDIEYSETKADKGFTAIIRDYQAPFFFDQPYGEWNDLQTVIHEFGHYNNAYHVQYSSVDEGDNLDVAETQSQGLELLALEYADEIYGSGLGDEVRIRVLSNMCETILDACAYDEFQYRVFTYDGELTTDLLNDMFSEIYCTYHPDMVKDNPGLLNWVLVSHTFEAPMYYISYGVSAMAALDIFAMSVDDREAGIDCYMNITNYGWETGFRQMLDETGIPDFFEEENVEDIAIAIREYSDSMGQGADITVWIIFIGVLTGLALFIVLIIVLIAMKHSKKERILEEENRRRLEMHYMQQNSGYINVLPGSGYPGQISDPTGDVYTPQMQNPGEKAYTAQMCDPGETVYPGQMQYPGKGEENNR